MPGGAHGIAHVIGIEDPKLYVTAGGADDPGYEIVAVGGDSADNGPVRIGGRRPLPGVGSSLVYDDATQQIHVLGRAPVPDGADGRRRRRMDRVRHRTARQRGLRGRPAAGGLRARGLGARRRIGLPRGGPPAAPRVRRGRGDRHDRDWLARLRVADARGHRGRAHVGVPLSARPDPVRTPARGGPRRRVRVPRWHALRPVADRHERCVRGLVHPGRLHHLRGRLDGLVAVARRVLGSHAGHRPAAGPRPGVEMGRGLRHRGHGAAAARSERPRSRDRDPRPDRDHQRARLPGDQRARGPGPGQPPVPRDDGRADPDRGRRRGLPSDRLDGRGDAVRRRRPGRAGCAAVLRRPGARPVGSPRDGRVRRRHAAVPRHRRRARLTGRLRGLPVRRRHRVRAHGRTASPGRPDARPGTACAAAGRLASPGMAAGPADGLGGPLPRRRPGRRLRRELPAVGVRREPPAVGGFSGRQHRPEPGRPDRVDVRLPQRTRRWPSGVLAVVGLAVRPQARVVLPGQLRRLDERGRSTMPATS